MKIGSRFGRTRPKHRLSKRIAILGMVLVGLIPLGFASSASADPAAGYQIQSGVNGLCLGANAYGAGGAYGNDCNGSDLQGWIFANRNGAFTWIQQKADPNKCLQPSTDFTSVVVAKCDFSDTNLWQKWDDMRDWNGKHLFVVNGGLIHWRTLWLKYDRTLKLYDPGAAPYCGSCNPDIWHQEVNVTPRG